MLFILIWQETRWACEGKLKFLKFLINSIQKFVFHLHTHIYYFIAVAVIIRSKYLYLKQNIIIFTTIITALVLVKVYPMPHIIVLNLAGNTMSLAEEHISN